MSTFSEGDYYSAEAAADLSAKQFYIVKTDTAGKVVLAAAATDKILGVLANAPELGETADVAAINGSGSFKVIAGDTISKDDMLTTDGSGKAVATTSTGNIVFGRATRSAVAGDILEYIKLNEKY